LWLGSTDSFQIFPLKFSTYFSNISISFILVVQFFAGVCMFYSDMVRPFSEAKQVNRYLEEKNLSNVAVASFYNPIPSISCYLQHKMYCLPEGNLESYFRWNKASVTKEINSLDLTAAKQLAKQLDNSYILITHSRMLVEVPGIVLLKQFTHGIIKVENFYVYHVDVPDKD
jgi:hypothetical protein